MVAGQDKETRQLRVRIFFTSDVIVLTVGNRNVCYFSVCR